MRPLFTEQELAARKKYLAMSSEEKVKYIKTLSPEAAVEVRYHPLFSLRDKQIVPAGSWRYCFVKAGRGFGKTKMGAAWIRLMVDQNRNKKGFAAIVGPTHGDVSKTMVPAIINEFPPKKRPKYNEQKGEIVFHNGATIHCFSSDQEIRGGNYQYVWADEMCKWCESIPEKIKDRFSTLDFACRIGDPKFLITTTPKPFKIFLDWQKRFNEKDPLITIVSGSMHENTALSEAARQALQKEHGGSRYGRQEIEGDLIEEAEGALWSSTIFDANRVKHDQVPTFIRTIVAVDPSVSSTGSQDETGVIVGALGIDGNVYILDDLSGHYSPKQWAQKAVAAYNKYGADRIVAEKNQGGALVEANIRTVNPYVSYKAVSASKGKVTRAEPIASLYELNKVKHVGNFNILEDQCCSYSPGVSSSPDRMDALVWCITELMLTRSYTHRNADHALYF